MNKILTLAMAGCLALQMARAQTDAHVVVTKTTGNAVSADISAVTASGGNAAISARRTLENNLRRSGWMQVAPPKQGAVQVSGVISENNGQLSFPCTVTDRTGKTCLNATYAQPATQAHVLAHQVANDIVKQVTGKPSFFLAKLVLIGIKGQGKELFIADSSMQDIRQITQDRTISVKPRWSTDNRFISYTSYLKRFPDIYTIDLTNGNRAREAAWPGVNAGGAISPDGRSMALVLSKDGNPDLYIKDRASGRLTRLTNTPRAVEGSPAWSPDGSRIVYVSDISGTPQLYIISRNGGQPRRLTMRGSQNVAPDWGANGLIAYQSLQGGRFQIAIIDPANKQDVVITPYDAAYEDPSWAPDGRHIAASRIQNYRNTIYLLDTMGGEPVALSNSGEWSAPAWSH